MTLNPSKLMNAKKIEIYLSRGSAVRALTDFLLKIEVEGHT